MKLRRIIGEPSWPFKATLRLRLMSIVSFAVLGISACNQIGTPKGTPFIAETAPSLKHEFRWTNGKMPKSFDPALASAPPETDLVRALFEGLTETDPKTLAEVPGVAERWTASEDLKTWTFYLRPDAKWSNGNSIVAGDFVRSWTRVAKMGKDSPHGDLLSNIQGIKELSPTREPHRAPGPETVISKAGPEQSSPSTPAASPTPFATTPPIGERETEIQPAAAQPSPEFNTNRVPRVLPTPEVLRGVSVEGDRVLKVSLILPDRDFAKLVASPVFRPTLGDIRPAENGMPNANIVTNGAFKISGVGSEGITLVRSDNYWNKETVDLERVRFVPKDSAEKALEAYRNGEVDVVTNAEFEPLALKLLTPYDDFRQTTHSALNFYEFNIKREPFSDSRVRQALAMAIEREVLTEGELEGSTRPALSFLPFAKPTAPKLTQDRDLARELLEDAGFPDGLDFPVIRLVVNRNDVQQRIAKLVARMWKRNLNIDTDIIVKSSSDADIAHSTGDYDLIRRGVVFSSNDEAMSMLSVFGGDEGMAAAAGKTAPEREETVNKEPTDPALAEKRGTVAPRKDEGPVIDEDIALNDLRAIPLYFPTSYSLVKPYVSGFEINGLDATSLKDVKIDDTWQPK